MYFTATLDCTVYRNYCFTTLCGPYFMIVTVLETLYIYHNFVIYSWTGPVPAGPTTNTAQLPPQYEGNTRGCHCSH
jgi:hypothetical protein